MATLQERAKLVLENIADDPAKATNALAIKVANAFAAIYRPGETLTNAQKAGLFIFKMRQHVKDLVRTAEVEAAKTTAGQAAAPGADIDLGADGDMA